MSVEYTNNLNDAERLMKRRARESVGKKYNFRLDCNVSCDHHCMPKKLGHRNKIDDVANFYFNFIEGG